MAALTALATADDLADRNITVPAGFDPDVILASATDAVRDAAGCPISVATSTVALVVDDWCEIDLPAGPVASVASVVVDGSPVTGWRKVGDTLYMPRRWTSCLPVEVTVTYTHGLTVVPKDIVDLVCGAAAIAMSGEYGEHGRLASIKLGDFAEKYSRPAGADSPSPVALPDSVRDRLRARFGTSVAVLRVKS